MYPFRFFSLLMVISLTSLMRGMDSAPAGSLVQQWIQCACACDTTYFSWLPVEVQGRIIAQVDPHQSLDRWMTGTADCVREITIPHRIYSFDISDDTLACFIKKPDHDNAYEICRVNLVYGDYKRWFKKVHDSQAPKIALRGDVALFETKCMNINIANIDEKLVGNTEISKEYIKGDLAGATLKVWNYHKSLPLFAVVFSEENFDIVETYKMSGFDRDGGDLCKFAKDPQDRPITLQWHPSLPILTIGRYDMLHVENLDDENDSINYTTQGRGEAHFSFDGYVAYRKASDYVKLIYCNVKKKNVCYIGSVYMPSREILRGVGEKYFLTEGLLRTDVCDNEIGNNSYAFRPLEFESDKEIPISTFSNHQGLHRLPCNGDYRYVTITSQPNRDDATITDSKISIYVPNEKICFTHYCMMRAAQEAVKTNVRADWDLFKQSTLQDLVTQTASFYPYFEKLMIDNGISVKQLARKA